MGLRIQICICFPNLLISSSNQETVFLKKQLRQFFCYKNSKDFKIVTANAIYNSSGNNI